jgi:hypothetical protein
MMPSKVSEALRNPLTVALGSCISTEGAGELRFELHPKFQIDGG